MPHLDCLLPVLDPGPRDGGGVGQDHPPPPAAPPRPSLLHPCQRHQPRPGLHANIGALQVTHALYNQDQGKFLQKIFSCACAILLHRHYAMCQLAHLCLTSE